MTAPPMLAAPPIVTLPGMSKDDIKRVAQIKEARRGYRGEFDPLLDKEDGTPDFNVYDNRLAPVVDKGVSWLFGQPVTITVQLSEGDNDTGAAAGDTTGTNAAQAYLEKALGDMDDFLTVCSEAAMNGGVTGHAFWKIVPADADEGEEFPQIVVLDPELCWVESDPDDVKKIVAYNIQWQVPNPQNLSRPLIKRQRIARVDPDSLQDVPGADDLLDTWTIGNYEADNLTTNKWRQIGEVEAWVNPSTGEALHWPPIVDNPNLPSPNELWGKSDTPPALIGMNRQINLMNSIIAKLLWFYASPILWSNLDSRQIIKARPGFVTGLGPNGQMNAIEAHGDVAAAMAFVADLRSSMDEQSRVPAVALGRYTDFNMRPTSGIALRLMFQPLLEQTETKRRLYGRALRDLCQRILALGGYGDGENLPVQIEWRNLLPVDEVQELQGALIKQQLGYPLKTIMEELGDDYNEQMMRKEEEDKQNADKFNAGTGPAPQAVAAGQQPMPPEMQQNQQQMPPAMQQQQAKLTGG